MNVKTNPLRAVALLVFSINTVLYFALVFILGIGEFIYHYKFYQYLFFYFMIILSLYIFRGYDYSSGREPKDIAVLSFVGLVFAVVLSYLFIKLFSVYNRINRDNFFIMSSVFLLGFPLGNVLLYRVFENKMPEQKVLVLGERSKWEPLMNEIFTKTNGKLRVVGWLDSDGSGIEDLDAGDIRDCKVIIADDSFVKDTSCKNKFKLSPFNILHVDYLPIVAENILKRIPLEVSEAFCDYYALEFNIKRIDTWKRALDLVFAC